MEHEISIFETFGGIRPMARSIGEASSTVANWKRVGRIPAEKQPHVLNIARSLGLPVTAYDVIFPLGDAPPATATAAETDEPYVECGPILSARTLAGHANNHRTLPGRGAA